MANEKVSALPTVSTAANADILYAIQSGVSVQETVQQVSDRVFNNISTTYAGDPNGNVAGSQLQYLYDSANNLIWYCKTSGTASTAVWIPSFGTMTNGQIAIGSTGTFPVLGTITAGSGVTITNGPGTIEVSLTGVGLSWNEVGTTSQVMAANNGYVTNNSSLVTLTLPATASFGSRLEICGKGSGGWKIAQNASQTIQVGANATTTGTGGYVSSGNQFDSIVLLCTTANTTWTVLTAPQGSLSVN